MSNFEIWSLSITATGIVATSIFSFLIWKVTRLSAQATQESANAAKESAKAAQASYELSNSMMEKQKESDIILKEHYRSLVLFKARMAFHILRKIDPREDIKPMFDIPSEVGLAPEKLSLYFTSEEMKQIQMAWGKLTEYLNQHWPNFDQKRATFDRDSGYAAMVATDKSIDEFERLITILES